MLYKNNLIEFSVPIPAFIKDYNSLDPRDHGITNDDIYEWRTYLRHRLLIQRNNLSDWSGEYLTQVHMHEGILTRANVPRNVKWHIHIFHPYNCFLLLPEEHIPCPPSREWCIQKAYDRYGVENVRDWYYSLPFKVYPFKLL